MSEKIGKIEELGGDLDGALQAYDKTEVTLRDHFTSALVCLKLEREKNARHVAGAELTQRVLRDAQEENRKLKALLDKLSRFPGSEPGFVVGARVRHKATSLVGTLRSGSSVNNIPTWRVECRIPFTPDDKVVVVYGEWTESELEVIETEK